MPPYYDSLLAKVIVHGNDREEALGRMGQALDSFILEGVTTTIPFLARVIRHPDFVAGEGRHQVPRAGIAPPPARRMRLDVVFTPAGLSPAEVQGRTVFVIDILRATTTMCAALSHGAKAIIPVASTEEALRLAQTIGSADVLLAGEKNCVRIPGFELGNSPLEMTEAAVRGKTIVVTTTNGTKALLAMPGRRARSIPPRPPTSRVAGERAREALEREERRPDRLRGPGGRVLPRRCVLRRPARRGRAGRAGARAGAQRRRARRASTWCGATATAGSGRSLGSRAGRELIRLGFGDDVADAARLDAYPVLPHFHERRVTLAPVPV